MKKLGILLSGRGSNFVAIADSVAAGKIPAQIAVVLSDKPTAHGLERAKERGIRAECIPSQGMEREAYERLMVARLQEAEVDVVCLAGFMPVLSPYFTEQFPNRVLNIHPSLLPSFLGVEAQKQALEHGVRFSGCTVHLVDGRLDADPILVQAVVPVLDGDTEDSLSERILKEEYRIYTEAINLVLSGKFRVEGRRVIRGESLTREH